MSAVQPGHGSAGQDDPWSCDYPARIALAKSILQHTDAQHWRQAIDRALLALAGATIDEIREVAS